MKAIRFVGDGRHEFVSLNDPKSAPKGEALIRVMRAGICGTDLHVLSTPMRHPATPGIILGHEFVGEVVEVGPSVTHVQAGDHVAIQPSNGCGLCRACRQGHTVQCRDRVVLGVFQDGGMTEVASVPGWALYKISSNLSWTSAALLEPLSCIVSVVRAVHPRPGKSAAVLGAGPMGLLAISLMAACGLNPIVCFEPSERRRDLAKTCGATHCLLPTQLSLDDWQLQTGLEEGASVVVEAVGHLLAEAVDLVADFGCVAQVGLNTAAVASIRPSVLLAKQARIIGVGGNEGTMPSAIDLLEKNVIRPEAIVTHEVGLEEFDESLSRMRDGTAGKVLITP